MIKPNWFDRQFAGTLEKASAQDALQAIARDAHVQKVLADALADHDTHAKEKGWVGPSRTQVVRNAIAGCLTAQD